MRICTLCLQNYSKYIITFEDNSEKYFLGIVAKKILSVFCARSTKKKSIYIYKFIVAKTILFCVCVREAHTHKKEYIYLQVHFT